MLDQECHIASVVVLAQPDCAADLASIIASLAGVDVPVVGANGKLIITIEAADERQLLTQIDTIRDLDGVHAATLVYHQYLKDDPAEADLQGVSDHAIQSA